MDAAQIKKTHSPRTNGTALPLKKKSVTMGYFVKDFNDTEGSFSLCITCEERVGSLAAALAIFKTNHVNLHHIESRPSKIHPNQYDFLINADTLKGGVDEAIAQLKAKVGDVKVLARSGAKANQGEVVWFPHKIKELDRFASQILSYGSDLDADHPGFTDDIYRNRRKLFADIAYNYRHGESIPQVDYSESEVKTWATVMHQLLGLYPTHACREFNYIFPLLVENCGYRPDNIPQLQDVSDFLKDCTGFTLRPVAGLLSSRDFLGGLAFRVFHSTQYIRHSSMPLYTPEPDVCHELLGHAPLFCDPEFAKFSQEIGLASLGASEEDIEKLATLYWFTIEFGLCRQDNEVRAFGAGLLSSYGELTYCLTDKPEHRPFEPSKTCLQKYPITEYQPTYFVADSFKDAREKLTQFSQTIKRPFTARYNPYTQQVEMIDHKDQVKRVITDICSDLSIVQEALDKIVL